ncbi:MAG: response regulator transcription factor, partial [Deltaproteobacteria bacterium]|nr:response regulator transcription factor [Deltaproteobacteria bacterium]
MKKILIIDDDRELCRMLADYLSREEYECSGVHDGLTGLEASLNKTAPFDLVILDVMLPGRDGFEVLREIRRQNQILPVIMLTAKGEPIDRVVGLEMGADDYLPKPFEPRELLARIHSLARRVSRNQPPEQPRLAVENLILDSRSLQAELDGRALNLTPAEFKVLWVLAANAGTVVTRETLFRLALGRREQTFDRCLDMHISRVRKKVWTGAEG